MLTHTRSIVNIDCDPNHTPPLTSETTTHTITR